MGVVDYIRKKKAEHREAQLARERIRSDAVAKEAAQVKELKRYEKEKAKLATEKQELRTLQRQNSPVGRATAQLKAIGKNVKQQTGKSSSPFAPTSSDRVRNVYGGGKSAGNVFSNSETSNPWGRQEVKKPEGKRITIHVK